MKQGNLIFIISFFILMAFNSHIVRAQYTQGTIKYLRTENWTKMIASLVYSSKKEKESSEYMSGTGNHSTDKSYTLLHFNSTESKYEDSDELVETGHNEYSNQKKTFFNKRNFEKNTLYDRMDFLRKTYIIKDTLILPKWKILSDMKEIAGHICMNASLKDTLRNQNIIAWFTNDIPLCSGPERFIGLPGMILEVDINDGALLLTAQEVEIKPLTNELDVPQRIKGKKINMAAYQLMLEKHIKECNKIEYPWIYFVRY